VPNSVLADSEFNVWEALKPLLTRAAARAIDAAILFGTNAPASWTSECLYADPIYFETTLTDAILADWSKVLVGIRQDLKVQIFDTGVISDADGVVVSNLLQQGMSALRMTMRLGYLLAKPVTAGAGGSPAGLLQPATAGS
ncbi:MAG: hypothetical protein WCF04_02260, partial [Candidatus Nanopelagicales bacterium]